MKGFKDFLLTTNALALAIGVIIGAAAGAVVNSLVQDIILPPIGLALGGVDFSNLKIVLQDATGGDPATEVAIRWGAFINTIISFVVIAGVVYWLSKLFIKQEAAGPTAEETLLTEIRDELRKRSV
jgi:large conductance mechanosensitive channel